MLVDNSINLNINELNKIINNSDIYFSVNTGTFIKKDDGYSIFISVNEHKNSIKYILSAINNYYLHSYLSEYFDIIDYMRGRCLLEDISDEQLLIFLKPIHFGIIDIDSLISTFVFLEKRSTLRSVLLLKKLIDITNKYHQFSKIEDNNIIEFMIFLLENKSEKYKYINTKSNTLTNNFNEDSMLIIDCNHIEIINVYVNYLTGNRYFSKNLSNFLRGQISKKEIIIDLEFVNHLYGYIHTSNIYYYELEKIVKENYFAFFKIKNVDFNKLKSILNYFDIPYNYSIKIKDQQSLNYFLIMLEKVDLFKVDIDIEFFSEIIKENSNDELFLKLLMNSFINKNIPNSFDNILKLLLNTIYSFKKCSFLEFEKLIALENKYFTMTNIMNLKKMMILSNPYRIRWILNNRFPKNVL